MKIATFNTYPSKKDHFWQVVLIPTVTVLNNIDAHDNYIATSVEWLFWSVTFIMDNK